MTYKILSSRQADITLITTVEYNLDGTIVTTEVPHFMPKSQAEIEQNIINRAASEVVRLQAEQEIANLIPSLPINEEKPIE
jgi:type III secretion system FlhB-like substrate exporter